VAEEILTKREEDPQLDVGLFSPVHRRPPAFL